MTSWPMSRSPVEMHNLSCLLFVTEAGKNVAYLNSNIVSQFLIYAQFYFWSPDSISCDKECYINGYSIDSKLITNNYTIGICNNTLACVGLNS